MIAKLEGCRGTLVRGLDGTISSKQGPTGNGGHGAIFLSTPVTWPEWRLP